MAKESSSEGGEGRAWKKEVCEGSRPVLPAGTTTSFGATRPTRAGAPTLYLFTSSRSCAAPAPGKRHVSRLPATPDAGARRMRNAEQQRGHTLTACYGCKRHMHEAVCAHMQGHCAWHRLEALEGVRVRGGGKGEGRAAPRPGPPL